MAVDTDQWRRDAETKLKKMPDEAKEIRQAALDDLYFFAKLVNPGYVYGEVHKELFQWMQNYSLYGADEEGSTNKLIMLPRAHLKSHMVATWVAWLITRHPEITILYISATSTLAETQLYSIKNILESSIYQRYFPEYINPQEGLREKWSSTAICVDHVKRKTEGIRDATIATAGLTTNTTGWHADVIVADDLVVPENAYTEDGRDGVLKKSSQFTSIRNAGGFTMACGTRYHPNDIYATWKNQEYDVYDDEGELIGKRSVWEIKEYAVEVDGVFVWPKTMRADGKFFGFDQKVLARIRAEYADTVQFFAQYYNNPNDPGSNRIERSRFQYYDRKFLKQRDGYWYFKDKRLNVYAAIDFAFSLSKKADFTAIVVIGLSSDNNYYILDIDLFKTNKIATYFEHIIAIHSKWELKKLRAEVTVAQAIIVQDLKDRIKEQGSSIVIEEYRPMKSEGSKEERMQAALESKYDNQQMWHFKGGYIDVLEEQLILARPANDDIKDALASAVSIAVKPKERAENTSHNVVQFHPRFGGVRVY